MDHFSKRLTETMRSWMMAAHDDPDEIAAILEMLVNQIGAVIVAGVRGNPDGVARLIEQVTADIEATVPTIAEHYNVARSDFEVPPPNHAA